MTRCRAARLSALALAAAACASAHAESSPYFIGLSQTFSHDSNLLRLADGQEAPLGYERADTVSSTALLAGLDQSFGRQRAYGNLNVRDNRYSNNKLYNNLSYNASAGIDWSTANRVSGSLTTSANRSLQRFNDGEISLVTEKNLERVQNFGSSISVGMVTEYTLEANVGRRVVKNSLQSPNVQAREFNQDNVAVGLRWRPSGASSLGVSVGGAKGRYPKFRILADGRYEADRFDRKDLTLNASYVPSGASKLDLRLSRSSTTYDLNQQRDFSGFTGSLQWNWQATGKTTTFLTLARDTGQDSYATQIGSSASTTDYGRVNNTLRAQVEYQFTSKVSFSTGFGYYDRELVRTVPNFTTQDADGRDRTTALTLGARWSALRNAMVGCDVGSEKRRAKGQLSYDFSVSTFSCYGQITLQ